MGFEYLRVKNWEGRNWVEMLSIDWKKQNYIRSFPGLDASKFRKIKPSGCDCPEVEYIDRDYFNKLEIKYNELRS